MLTQNFNLIPRCSLKQGKEVETSEDGYNAMGPTFLCLNKAKNGQYGTLLLQLNLMTLKVLFQSKWFCFYETHCTLLYRGKKGGLGTTNMSVSVLCLERSWNRSSWELCQGTWRSGRWFGTARMASSKASSAGSTQCPLMMQWLYQWTDKRRATDVISGLLQSLWHSPLQYPFL